VSLKISVQREPDSGTWFPPKPDGNDSIIAFLANKIFVKTKAWPTKTRAVY
jgi:hypothetical protein